VKARQQKENVAKTPHRPLPLSSGWPLVKTALLIEDTILIQYLHNHYLQALGFIVDIVSTQKAALHHAFKQRYDLIIADLGLADNQNETLIRHLRSTFSLNRTTPLIVVTATGTQDIKVRCLKAGANAFMVKPVSKSVLEKILYTLGHGKPSFNELEHQPSSK